MGAAAVEARERDLSEAERVERWRYQEFRRMGFSIHQATLLAESTAVLRDAEALVLDRNCPLHVAFKILA